MALYCKAIWVVLQKNIGEVDFFVSVGLQVYIVILFRRRTRVQMALKPSGNNLGFLFVLLNYRFLTDPQASRVH